MKKILTVSIMAVMAVTAANAEIASKAYVDQQRGAAEDYTDTKIGTYTGAAEGATTVAQAIALAVSGGTEGVVTRSGTEAVGSATVPVYVNASGVVAAGTPLKDLAYKDKVAAGDIEAGAIVDADISSSAAIAKTKLATDVQTTLTNADADHTKLGETVAADFTKLHAVTADATELNYVDGVTSNIQTQLDAKATAADYVPKTTTVNSKALSDNVVLAGSDVAVTGYAKADSAAAIAATDTVNAALGKLEYKVDAVPAQQSADWNATSGVTQILNKPTLGDLAAKDTVGTDDIDANAVTSAKIANDAVTLQKITSTLPSACAATGAECVLKSSNGAVAWEVIQRGTGETPNNTTGSNAQ